MPTPEEKDPAVQEMHVEAPDALLYDPAGQEVQEVEEEVLLYFPAAQELHTVFSLADV